MSLSFEEQISIGRKISDSEYNKYVEDFLKDYAVSKTKNTSPEKMF